MEVTIRPKNFKLTSSIESQIRKRVDRLPRQLDNMQSAEVVLAQRHTHLNAQRFEYVVQLTVHTPHNLIRSEVADPEILTAMDNVVNHLSRQIERYKGKLYHRHKGKPGLGRGSADVVSKGAMAEVPSVAEMAAPAQPATTPTKAPSPNGAVEEDEAANIVRVKRFHVKPMFPEEAIEQMELLGHTFYVFWNAGDDRMSVIYRRNDGDYGLLEPELT
jgi:putative sigma-54 modulation protein